MANVGKMFELFESIESAINDEAADDEAKRKLLERFIIRLFGIFDGIEGPTLDWKGISLVAKEDLPKAVDEINDEFLHDAWTHRK